MDLSSWRFAQLLADWTALSWAVVMVLRCRYSNSDQLRDLLGQLLHDLDRA
jgi:hypothetical protein